MIVCVGQRVRFEEELALRVYEWTALSRIPYSANMRKKSNFRGVKNLSALKSRKIVVSEYCTFSHLFHARIYFARGQKS